MAVINVSDKAGLVSALRVASGGDSIVLADGDYGDVVLSGRYTGKNLGSYDAPVTISSAHPGGRCSPA